MGPVLFKLGCRLQLTWCGAVAAHEDAEYSMVNQATVSPGGSNRLRRMRQLQPVGSSIASAPESPTDPATVRIGAAITPHLPCRRPRRQAQAGACAGLRTVSRWRR